MYNALWIINARYSPFLTNRLCGFSFIVLCSSSSSALAVPWHCAVLDMK